MNHHYVEDWVDWLTNVRRLRAATIGAYEETMNAFVLWLVTADMVNDALSTTWETVTPEQIEQFMGRHRRGGVGKPATQDRDRACINEFYKWLNDIQLVHPAHAVTHGKSVHKTSASTRLGFSRNTHFLGG